MLSNDKSSPSYNTMGTETASKKAKDNTRNNTCQRTIISLSILGLVAVAFVIFYYREVLFAKCCTNISNTAGSGFLAKQNFAQGSSSVTINGNSNVSSYSSTGGKGSFSMKMNTPDVTVHSSNGSYSSGYYNSGYYKNGGDVKISVNGNIPPPPTANIKINADIPKVNASYKVNHDVVVPTADVKINANIPEIKHTVDVGTVDATMVADVDADSTVIVTEHRPNKVTTLVGSIVGGVLAIIGFSIVGCHAGGCCCFNHESHYVSAGSHSVHVHGHAGW